MYYLLFIRHAFSVLEDPVMNDIVTFLLVFVCSPNYISNPYLVAKIVEVCKFDLQFISFLTPATFTWPTMIAVSETLINDMIDQGLLILVLLFWLYYCSFALRGKKLLWMSKLTLFCFSSFCSLPAVWSIFIFLNQYLALVCKLWNCAKFDEKRSVV